MRILQNTAQRPVAGVSFGPGPTLVAGGGDGYDVWDLKRGSHVFLPSHAVKSLYGCVCDPDGRWIYVSDYRAGFRLLPLAGEAPPVPGSPHERHVVSFRRHIGWSAASHVPRRCGVESARVLESRQPGLLARLVAVRWAADRHRRAVLAQPGAVVHQRSRLAPRRQAAHHRRVSNRRHIRRQAVDRPAGREDRQGGLRTRPVARRL